MKIQEMLDPTMLAVMGLMDHPSIIDMEKRRLAYNKKIKEIEEMAERLMGIDTDLDDLLLAVARVNEIQSEKDDKHLFEGMK